MASPRDGPAFPTAGVTGATLVGVHSSVWLAALLACLAFIAYCVTLASTED
jgi:hypothetical protein